MYTDQMMLYAYRGIAGIVALAMAARILRRGSWREQFYAALVFVPFALRALGIK
jgi:hypothetical protein